MSLPRRCMCGCMLHTLTSSLNVASASTWWLAAPGGIANSGLAIMPVRTSRFGGSFAKINPMRDRSRAGRSVGRVVHLEHQRRALRNALRHAGQEHRRVLADRPVHQHLIAGPRDRRRGCRCRARTARRRTRRGRARRSRCAGAAEAIGLIVTTVGRVLRLRLPHVDDDVMHVRAIAGSHFAGLHPPVLGEVGRHLEVLVFDRRRVAGT